MVFRSKAGWLWCPRTCHNINYSTYVALRELIFYYLNERTTVAELRCSGRTTEVMRRAVRWGEKARATLSVKGGATNDVGARERSREEGRMVAEGKKRPLDRYDITRSTIQNANFQKRIFWFWTLLPAGRWASKQLNRLRIATDARGFVCGVRHCMDLWNPAIVECKLSQKVLHVDVDTAESLHPWGLRALQNNCSLHLHAGSSEEICGPTVWDTNGEVRNYRCHCLWCLIEYNIDKTFRRIVDIC